MITTKNLADFLKTGLNTNSYSIVFDIEDNYNEFEKKVNNKVRYEDAKSVVYGVLQNIRSEAVPVKNLGHYIITSELQLVVTTNELINENLDNVYDVLQSYYEATIGDQTDLEGYKISVNLQVPTVGQERIDQLGGTVNVNVICTFTVTKNAYSFNDVKWYIDGQEITQLLSWNMNNIKEAEIISPPNTSTKKTRFRTQGISISFTLPHLNLAWFKSIFDDYYVDRDLNKSYTLKYVDTGHSAGITFTVGIAEMPLSGLPNLANGIGIVFAELKEL